MINIATCDGGRSGLKFSKLPAFLVACLWLGTLWPMQAGVMAAEGEGETETPGGAEDTSSTIVYDHEFFSRYPNAVSVLDLIRRIPSGQRILDASGDNSGRGFSSNNDLILINGKRMSGKSNDSESALGRITVDQVTRIEIIRGSSPDIKISSQESIINIVTNGAAGKGSGSWRADARIVRGRDADPAGFLSYGGKIGALDYFVSVEAIPKQRKDIRQENFFDPGGGFTIRLDEINFHDDNEYKLSSNLTYTIGNGDTIRLNSTYTDRRTADRTSGILSTPDAGGALVPAGISRRIETSGKPEWEIGGDYETTFGDDLSFRLLGLHSETDSTSGQREDFLITGVEPEDDFVIIFSEFSTESIARASLTWNIDAAHDLEFGTEVALNKVDSSLEFLLRQGGVLVPQPVDAANVTVKEFRDESFVIHTWKINGKMSLDSQIYSEFSRITQNGVGVDVSRDFFFLRPSFDYRYNISPSDQLQISLRRDIGQLNFGDFASSASGDDQVVGGNADLVPWKRWDIEASFEHRLANDGGRIKLSLEQRFYQDRIELIEVSPGVSGVGNVGSGRLTEIALDGSFRLAMLGLPNVLVEPRVAYIPTRVTDPFTGQRRLFNGWNDYYAKIRFRHDISDWGLSYGGEVANYGGWSFFDIDERIDFPSRTRLDLFAEQKIFAGLILRVDAENLTDRREGRVREFFAGGVAGGLLTNTEQRDRSLGRWFTIGLKGVF